ncbi:malate dehydrogenase [Microlunatus phosphovorus NM-1]|uniref:Malate dehydrogenase n=1 Tax=Microlunatus phosphovorus (strain ATCC 700054 / DSM 10555 / JCM 9379 / NBRC 101784 / NCIMB 13414 / VKM Ac-1990 / NM-1) TaxID=1032480 RepID=F5XLL6_MICPN|nr:NAD-dependent malic enzyme [Microlunatus phosphovorus]BAK36282.1 malate dehydrogenase [Microlunatus phosphovorus NM-1]
MASSTPSPGYSITLRVAVNSAAGSTTDLASAVAATGAAVTALDIVESSHDAIVVDVTCNTVNEAHADQITEVINARPGMTVRKVSDRTFLLHLGGKLSVEPKVPLKNRDDLSRAYTPGVARVCLAIHKNPEDARRLTIKRNTVAVVTDGTAVLGLGDIGPAAALPVMEGKAALFKQFAGVDAWPVCLDTTDTEEIISIVKALAPVYGGVNLEDISAPRCFEIERRLRDELDIPVFHDDQHGTAIVVLAALINALRVVDKSISDVKIVVSGVGAAGHAIIQLLQAQGAAHIVAVARAGAIHRGETYTDEHRTWIAEHTNEEGFSGTLEEALVGADVFIGVSGPNLFGADEVATMAPGAIVLALANPDPEVHPTEAAKHAAVVATGRSDFPNQINNVLAFPGLFRGLLDAAAADITTAMLVAAAEAIANCVSAEELNPSYIVPSVFDARVAPAVAEAVAGQAGRS